MIEFVEAKRFTKQEPKKFCYFSGVQSGANITHSGTFTSHPIEDGSNISDHYIKNDPSFNFTFYGHLSLPFIEDYGKDYINATIKSLEYIRKNMIIIDILGVQDIYGNSIELKDIGIESIPINYENKVGLVIALGLKQIVFTKVATSVEIQMVISNKVQAQGVSEKNGKTSQQPENATVCRADIKESQSFKHLENSGFKFS